MSIATIKTQIKTMLDELVTATVLGGATITDIRYDPLDSETALFPHAYLMPPGIETEIIDNRTNMRKYAFDIAVIFQAENITGTTEVETAIETIMYKFDNNPTLTGTALGGMSPISSAPVPFQHGGKDLIVATITIVAQDTSTLTFA